MKQAGGQTQSQNPLSRHDLDSLNLSSYLSLVFFGCLFLMEWMPQTQKIWGRAFVPDIKYFLQQVPASFSERCFHQGSFANSAHRLGEKFSAEHLHSPKSRGHSVPGRVSTWGVPCVRHGLKLERGQEPHQAGLCRSRSLDMAMGSYRGFEAGNGGTIGSAWVAMLPLWTSACRAADLLDFGKWGVVVWELKKWGLKLYFRRIA